MIDHIAGRPNPSWKRAQVFLVISFWLWRIIRGDPQGPRFLGLRRFNRSLRRFTPWQIILSALTALYAIRNLDKILGLGSVEPLANLYAPSYYRATWITTGLDAGFATAMSIRPKWLRDICSPLFAIYYIIYANEGDEKLRKFRAVPTVEMMRATWEKTTNPYVRLFTHIPSITIKRRILLHRPKSSTYERPITAWLFFAATEEHLSRSTDLIFDLPGGGFVAMTPEHHEERLRAWAIKTQKPVLSLEYGKAPEYPYPFAIDEAFDTYRLLVESAGKIIGMSGRKLSIIMSGDSAGATLVVNAMIKILETNSASYPSHQPLPLPVSLVLTYPCLDFNLTSWMTPSNLRVLRSEQSSGQLAGMKEFTETKDHLGHISPLSMAGTRRPSIHKKSRLMRKRSWKDTIMGFTGGKESDDSDRKPPTLRSRHSSVVTRPPPTRSAGSLTRASTAAYEDRGALADAESEDEADLGCLPEQDLPIEARVKFVYPDSSHKAAGIVPPPNGSVLELEQQQLSEAVVMANTMASGTVKGKGIGTRLTMTSRTGYFSDRIIPPSMMRAMAILYIGPHRNPDFGTDYHISPILAPSHLLAQFPPMLMQCGEKDPFVDDTVIFAGRVREAKRARKVELDLALEGKSARFGESLTMTAATTANAADSPRLAAMKRERDRLARESENDWVEMVLFSDWSHGYLQMPALMREAAVAIEELAEWIGQVFERHAAHETGAKDVKGHIARPKRGSPPAPKRELVVASPLPSETETDDPLTFVPKKLRDSASILRKRTGSSGSEATLRNESNEAVKAPIPLINGSQEIKRTQPVVASPPRVGTPGRGVPGTKAGQTISETELMRRRRLLDSHVFE